MDGFNLSFCLLNDSLNFVPSSPRLQQPAVNRFLFRIGFVGESTSSGLPYLTVRRVRSTGRPLFFHTVSPAPILFSWSWPFWMPRSFVRVIRGSRAAICHAQIQEFAPPERGRPAKKEERSRGFFLSALEEHVCHSILVSFEFFNDLRINLTRVAHTISVNKSEIVLKKGNVRCFITLSAQVRRSFY